MRGQAHRPLRFRGVDLARETRDRRASIAIALLLSVMALLTVMAGSGFAIELARGQTRNHMFWPAAVITWLFGAWVVPRAVRAWRLLVQARRPPSISGEFRR